MKVKIVKPTLYEFLDVRLENWCGIICVERTLDGIRIYRKYFGIERSFLFFERIVTKEETICYIWNDSEISVRDKREFERTIKDILLEYEIISLKEFTIKEPMNLRKGDK